MKNEEKKIIGFNFVTIAIASYERHGISKVTRDNIIDILTKSEKEDGIAKHDVSYHLSLENMLNKDYDVIKESDRHLKRTSKAIGNLVKYIQKRYSGEKYICECGNEHGGETYGCFISGKDLCKECVDKWIKDREIKKSQ